MHDPLSEVVRLLSPRAAFANLISGKGNWAVRYAPYGRPSFCIMLGGTCLLTVDGHEPITLNAGDFVLLPATPGFTISSLVPATTIHLDPHDVASTRGELRYGEPDGLADMRSLGGAFLFDGADAGLLVSLLPEVVHVADSPRLSQLVQMVGEESDRHQAGSDLVLSRLVELMLVEAMRAATTGNAPPGLLRGLGDERLARALAQIHARIDHAWTIDQLAQIAALSRSAFFSRFNRLVGVAPMSYLLAWRMEIAKGLLRDGELAVGEIAERVGYGSTSTFSAAFSRQVGKAPSQYARLATKTSGAGGTEI